MCKRFLSSAKSKKHSLLIAIIATVIIIFGLFPLEQFTGASEGQKSKQNQNNPDDMKNINDFSTPEILSQNENSVAEVASSEQDTEERILTVKIEDEKSDQEIKVAETSDSDEPAQKRRKLVLVTAFSSTVDQTDSTPFITASGTRVHDGTIAANFLKFGTKVKFPSLYGDKIFTVEDRMKSDYKVDIWFPTRQEALNFGAKRVEIEIQ